MKKHLLSLALAFGFMQGAFSQSIPNGGFEAWNVNNVDNPTYYFSSNLESGSSAVNVVKTNDSYSNSFAVKLTTVLSGNDTAMAYIANGDPFNTAGQGIPYTQQATGLQFRYKSAVMSGDTALIFVVFKKTGSVIGTYIKKIAGTQATYSLGTMGFSLAQAPDSVIFAAVSSNAMLSGGIPGSMLQLDSVLFTGVSSQPANMNGDFELWQLLTTKTPMGWTTNSSNSPVNVQTNDAYSGSYALELKTYGWNTYAVPDGVTTGINSPSTTIGGYPFSNTTDTLVFYYKYAPANVNDSASWSLGFKNSGSYFNFMSGKLNASSVYKKVKVTINLGMTPDTLVVFLNSSKSWSVPVSYAGASFKVDNMYLTSQQTPVTAIAAPSSGCVSQTVQLTDNSSNLPTSWTWTLTGSSSPTSTAANPVVSYSAAGTYTIMHNASNSSGSGSVVTQTIMINAVPTISVSGTSSVCAGSPATLNVTGTSTSYMWSNGMSNPTIITNPTVSTTYTVTGTSSTGCSNATTITVNASPLPNVFATAPTTVCAYATACLAASGAITYAWSGPCGFSSTLQSPCIPINPACACTFSVIGTNAVGCSKGASVCINVIPTPTVTALTSNSIICGPPFQGTATLTANGAVSYSWTPGGSGTSISVSPSVTTTYSVVGTGTNGCTSSAMITQTVSTCTGVDAQSGVTTVLNVYPNPNTGSFVISSTTEDQIIITNELGQHVRSITLDQNNNYKAQIEELNDGVYFAIGKYGTQRIVVLK
jgi:hypothetical protein